MITKSNLRNVLKALGFSQSDSTFTKHFEKHNCEIQVDFSGETNTPFYPTDHCGVLRLKTEHVLPKYMAHLLKKAGEKAGFKRSYRASIDRIKSLTVQAAPIEEQRIALQKIETYEAAITAAKSVLSVCAGKKKMILEKWL